MSDRDIKIVIDITHRGGAWDIAAAHSIINAAVTATLHHVKYTNQTEISIVLGDDAFIQTLNKQYRGMDKPTNVLSFPQDDTRHLGDVVLALETITREATAQGKSWADHLTHLTVHGVLHVLGFDHETDDEAQEMEALEVETLAVMGVANPYAD